VLNLFSVKVKINGRLKKRSRYGYVENVLPVETNIIIFNLVAKMNPAVFIQKLADQNIKAVGFGKQAIRFVTHLDFTDDMLTEVERVLKNIDS
jgi:threonine aldolase